MTKNINVEIKKMIDDRKETIISCKAEDETDVLIYDGIVDEKTFYQQKNKVLFLLKDGNDPNLYEDGNGYTYRDLYAAASATKQTETKSSRVYTMWRVMCMWIKIIEDKYFALEDCFDVKKEFNVDGMRKELLKIATVNIKKTAGKGTNNSSYSKVLKRSVETYYSLIKNEIDLIKPTIVICGGTFDYIKREYDVEIKKLKNGKRYFIYNDCVYLESVHPSAIFGYKKHFDVFKETYTELSREIKL